MIVVLEGTADATSAPAGQTELPRQVRYDIVGQSFDRPVIAVLAGTDVEIRNTGFEAPILAVDGQPDLIPSKPLNPQDAETFPAKAAGLIVLRAPQTPHLVGRVLVLSHRFFAPVDAAGEFKLDDVPPGRWTVRIWYRDGWLERTDEVIDVGRSKTSVDPKVADLTIAKAS